MRKILMMLGKRMDGSQHKKDKASSEGFLGLESE